MKSGAASWVVLLVVAIASSGLGQEHALPLPAPAALSTRNTGQNPSGASAGATPNQESNTAEHDDALYRGKTSDSENNMLRDEGALHFKSHGREKVGEVDSLKSLQSSGTDPKFQGSFIGSGVPSIGQVAEKANEAQQSEQPEYQGDPRFRDKRLTFSPQKEDEAKKTQADSSPSPTPSPSASPAKKKSSASKE